MDKPYHCIILSTKSAGSSALQKSLVQNYGFSIIKNTTHHENETLFWTKSASVLGLPQLKMHRSKVPYSPNKALESLKWFCDANDIGEPQITEVNKQSIFNAYYQLVMQYQPRFLEKSPHHLYNKSNLDLIGEFISKYQNNIQFKVIGLVRHPLSVVYSGWKRWQYDCSKFEMEWYISNKNLLDYQKYLNIDIVHYEELVESNSRYLKNRLALPPVSDEFRFTNSSLMKWKKDKYFGHKLRAETLELAQLLGYQDFETSEEEFQWKIKSLSTYVGAEMKRFLRQI